MMSPKSSWLLLTISVSVCVHGVLSNVVSERCVHADIGFVLDSSADLSVDSWTPMKRLVKGIIGRLDVGPDRNRIGLVQVSLSSDVEFHLETCANKSKGDIYRHIDDMTRAEHRAETAVGLRAVRTSVFGGSNGDRTEYRNIAIVITDGSVLIASEHTVQEARLLQSVSTVHVIGVTETDNAAALQEVASQRDFVTIAGDYETLTNNVDDVMSQICTADTAATPCSPQPLDLAFILDSSSSIAFFDVDVWSRDILGFVAAAARQLAIGPRHVRVGVVKFADDAAVEIPLDRYADVDALLPAVRRIAYSGGNANVAAGLRATRKDLFGSAGSGGGRKKLAVLLTDGPATVELENSVAEADALKDAGVEIVAIGLTADVIRADLADIASTPSNVWVVESYPFVDTALRNLTTYVCNVGRSESFSVVQQLGGVGQHQQL